MKKRIWSLMLALTTVVAISSCSDDPIEVSEVSLNSTALTLFIGESSSLTADIAPANAENKNIEWSTSNAAVAIVEPDGEITAVSPGVATITATALGNGISGSCTVTVKNGFVYGTERNEIIEGVYGNYSGGEADGGYQFWFYTDDEEDGAFDEAAEYIWIDIPTEMMGATFQLTEQNDYDWGWWIEYTIAGQVSYEGFGSEGNMEDVESGTMRADITGENTFKVTFDILFTDGKTLKGTFSGVMTEDDSYYGGRVGGRQSALNKNF
jgi:hypothetical protein